jgi:hypothetical protein
MKYAKRRLNDSTAHGYPPGARFSAAPGRAAAAIPAAREVLGWPQKMQVGPCIPAGLQLSKAEVGPEGVFLTLPLSVDERDVSLVGCVGDIWWC